MSRGLGKVQRKCLEVLGQHDGTLDSIEIACRALGKQEVCESGRVSYRRALRALAARRVIVDMGRHWRYGRRHWATPRAAKSYFDEVERAPSKSFDVRRVFGSAACGLPVDDER